MDQNIQNEPYNEFKDSPLYAFFQRLFGKKNKKPEDRLPDTEFSKFRSVDDKIVAFFHFFANISAVALIVIMLIAFVDVVGAKLHKAGLDWAHGISSSMAIIKYFHIPLVFLTAGYVTLDQGHTRIDLICGKFPRWLEKIFMLIGHILGAALSFYISFASVANILVPDIKMHKSITNIPGDFPKWPFTVCHILGFTLLGLSFVWSIVRMIRFWKYPGVNAYYTMHPEKAHGPDAPDEAPMEETLEGGLDA